MCDLLKMPFTIPSSPGSSPHTGTMTMTPWSMIGVVQQGGPDAAEAVKCLTAKYYRALKIFASKLGTLCPDPEEVAHAFIEHLLTSRLWEKADPSKGRLRNFLMTALKNFAINAWRKRKKISENEVSTGNEELLNCSQESEDAYVREWAVTVFRSARDSQRDLWKSEGALDLFDDLIAYISGASRMTSDEVGEKHNKSGEAIRTQVKRLKVDLRDALVAEIWNTLEDPTDDSIRDELRELIGAFHGLEDFLQPSF
jgi:DNA-directed RNA polymerase specialized sigma24 family protein